MESAAIIDIGKSITGIPAYNLLEKGEKPKNAADTVLKTQTKQGETAYKANFLFCIKCKNPITRESERIQVNQRHQHVFANPPGHVFQIGCFASAPGCFVYGEKTSYFTWFPGFEWQIALCGLCGTLMGWSFISKNVRFFGLILENIKKFDS